MTPERRAEIQRYIDAARQDPVNQAVARAGLTSWPVMAQELLDEVSRLRSWEKTWKK
jgi:hypothetical protein